MLMGGNRGGGQSFAQAWTGASLFYKSLVCTVLPLGIIGIVTIVFMETFAMAPILVFRFQLWRLFTSWLVDRSIINVLFAVFSLYFYLPPMEKKLSTVYTAFDFLVTTTIIQTVVCIVQFFGSFVKPDLSLVTMGLWSMWMVYISRVSYANPEEQSPFCCFPCTIKKKYFPVAFLVLFSLMGGLMVDFFIGFCLGLLEYAVLKGVLIRYPVSWILKIQTCLPQSVRRRSDFVSVDSCHTQLIGVCRGNPLQGRQPQNQIYGDGLALGTSQAAPTNINQQQLRDFWASKDQTDPANIMPNDSILSDGSERQFR